MHAYMSSQVQPLKLLFPQKSVINNYLNSEHYNCGLSPDPDKSFKSIPIGKESLFKEMLTQQCLIKFAQEQPTTTLVAF